MKCTVGQKLWYVPAHRWGGAPFEVTVTKVGRTWTTLSNGVRINAQGFADGKGYVSPGVCFLNREEHDKAVALEQAWVKLRTRMHQTYGGPPKGITLEAIERATRLIYGEEVPT